jgi:hypothetical protein
VAPREMLADVIGRTEEQDSNGLTADPGAGRIDGAFASGEGEAGVGRLPSALLVPLPQKVDALVAV